MYAVSVIGYGRFGALWSSILASHFVKQNQKVAVTDEKPIESHLLPKGIHACSLEEAVKYSRAIFLCIPISQMRDTLMRIVPYLNEKTIICDTCSVKALPSMWMKEILPNTQPILATHPLFGPDSFLKRQEEKKDNIVIMFPVRMNEDEYLYWVNTFSNMKLQPHTMTPEEHDKQVAYTQGLTHLVGRVLTHMKLSSQVVSTLGYESLLEIVTQTCSDSSTLFQDLHTYNNYSQEMREELYRALQDTLSLLGDDFHY